MVLFCDLLFPGILSHEIAGTRSEVMLLAPLSPL